jgi:hypothetical protein
MLPRRALWTAECWRRLLSGVAWPWWLWAFATNRGEFRMWERETGASGVGCCHICDVAGLSCAAGKRGRENLERGHTRYHSVMV